MKSLEGGPPSPVLSDHRLKVRVRKSSLHLGKESVSTKSYSKVGRLDNTPKLTQKYARLLFRSSPANPPLRRFDKGVWPPVMFFWALWPCKHLESIGGWKRYANVCQVVWSTKRYKEV